MPTPRKFDWDEAARLRAEGLTYAAIGERLGVTGDAVRLACDEAARRRDREQGAAWQRGGVCPDCGTQTTRRAGGRHLRCIPCAARLAATSVRADTLRCVTCREWLADTAFPSNRLESARRGRHSQCTRCQTAARRSHRQRNREAYNAYERAYRARKKAEAAT